LVNGISAIILALVLWRLTGSFVGWLVLFVPGAALIAISWVLIFFDKV
jgi:hypothetical protein